LGFSKKDFVMRAVLIFLALSMCVLAATQESGQGHSHLAYVKKVTDGDTIVISDSSGDNIPVRIIGIDCPESRKNAKCARDAKKGKKDCAAQIPMGKVATDTAKELLLNKPIILRCEQEECKKDRYGRRLHYIQLPGNIDFGLSMVEKGLCEEVSSDYPHPRQSEYQKAQARAKSKKLGIWK